MGKDFKDCVPPELYQTDDFIDAMSSTQKEKAFIPICDFSEPQDIRGLAVMAYLRPDSMWVNAYHKKAAELGGIPGDFISLLLDEKIPREDNQPKTFVRMQESGYVSSVRSIGEDKMKVFVPGNKAGAGHKMCIRDRLFGAGMIPSYINMSNLGLINSLWACILPGTCSAWNVMVMKSFFQGLPAELEEAAEIDGCGTLGNFIRIVLPLSKAVLATITLFGAVSYWNTYFSAVMYITKTAMLPLQVFLQKIVLSSSISDVLDVTNNLAASVPEEITKMATVVVAVVPILCVYPFLQKHFAKGVMIGAVKG